MLAVSNISTNAKDGKWLAQVAKPPRPAKSALRNPSGSLGPGKQLAPIDCEDGTAESFCETVALASSRSSFMSAAPSLSDCSSLSSGGSSSFDMITPSRTRAGSVMGMDPIEEHNEDAGVALSKIGLRAAAAAEKLSWTPKWLEEATEDPIAPGHIETIAPKPVRLRAPGKIDLGGLQMLSSPNLLGLRSLTMPPVPSPKPGRENLHGLGFEALAMPPASDGRNSCLWRPDMYEDSDDGQGEEPYPDIFEPRPKAPRTIDFERSALLDCISPLELSKNEAPAVVSKPATASVLTPRSEQNARALRFFGTATRHAISTSEENYPIGVMASPPLETIPLPSPYSPYLSPRTEQPIEGSARPRVRSGVAHFAAQLSRSSECPVPPSLRRSFQVGSSPAPSFPKYCPSPRLLDPYPSPVMPSDTSSGLYPPAAMRGDRRRNVSAGDLLFRNQNLETLYDRRSSESAAVKGGASLRPWSSLRSQRERLEEVEDVSYFGQMRG